MFRVEWMDGGVETTGFKRTGIDRSNQSGVRLSAVGSSGMRGSPRDGGGIGTRERV
jgi:hypothetical protein